MDVPVSWPQLEPAISSCVTAGLGPGRARPQQQRSLCGLGPLLLPSNLRTDPHPDRRWGKPWSEDTGRWADVRPPSMYHPTIIAGSWHPLSEPPRTLHNHASELWAAAIFKGNAVAGNCSTILLTWGNSRRNGGWRHQARPHCSDSSHVNGVCGERWQSFDCVFVRCAI